MERTVLPPALSHLELILSELEQVRMVGAEQECPCAGVRVGVRNFSGAATPITSWDRHFECLHTPTHKQFMVHLLVTDLLCKVWLAIVSKPR